ncbi:MAG TPA: CBS domain-containing protein [Nitrospiraceae bacterium]|nr:CBS domain-containing protein [Nitrospiraceae bacterium]
MITAQKLMKQDLAKVEDSSSVSEAAKLMKERKIGSVFVEHNDRIVGIVTETDIVRQIVGQDQMPGFVPVGSIMSSPVIGIEASRPITEAADLMERNQTRHLAVMRSGDIVGVLSVRDLLHPVSLDEF